MDDPLLFVTQDKEAPNFMRGITTYLSNSRGLDSYIFSVD